MTNKGQSKKKAPETCKHCEHWGRVRHKIRVHELLERTIEQFELKIAKTDYEPTVAEYVKLLQFGREIGQEDEPREIKVTWVGSTAASESER
jgi:hypothetical protein